jgi:SAM-dependent methyltransferase
VFGKIQEKLLLKLLLVPHIRTYFCMARWKVMKRNLRFHDNPTAAVGENVVKYNLTAFDDIAGFGCGGRMNLVLYPLSALIMEPGNAKVLIVGPRTEDDIFLAKALGISSVKGLDLFTYSPHIELGDMHNMPYGAEEFDAIVLGWVIAYSSDPALAIKECKRVLKKGGHLAIGWEWVPDSDKQRNAHIRGNPVNDVDDMHMLVGYPAVFVNDPAVKSNHHKAVIFKK